MNMRLNPRSWSAVVLGLLATLAPALVRAQGSPESTFVESIDVTLVNVEVVVTDAGGNPVTGLEKDDFEVFDDGRPVELTHFRAHQPAGRLGVQQQAAPSTADDPEERLCLILFVDNKFIAPMNRNRVFDHLRTQLDELMLGKTVVMVVNKDESVEIVQHFTTDRAEVEAAIDRIASSAGTSGLRISAERAVLRTIETAARPEPGAQFDPGRADAMSTLVQLRGVVDEQARELRRSAQMVSQFIGSLAGIPGRKALLYLSDGLPMQPGEKLYRMWYGKYETYVRELQAGTIEQVLQQNDMSRVMTELTADAAAHRVVFYPVGTPENVTADQVSAERQTLTASRYRQVYDSGVEGLRALALGTGGQEAFELGQVDDVLERLQKDFSVYYSFGYPSPHGGDGKSHQVEVKVKRDDVQVRYLERYRDKDPDQQMTDRTLSTLFLGAGTNPLGIRARVKEIHQEKKDRFLVSIEVRWLLSKIVLVPQEGFHQGSVTIFLVARDPEGGLSDTTKIQIPLKLPNESLLEMLSQSGSYTAKLMMAPGPQQIAIGVRDDVGAASSSITLDVDVAKSHG